MDPRSSIDIIAACMALPLVNVRIDKLERERDMLGDNAIADQRREEIEIRLGPLYQRHEMFHEIIFGGPR